MPVLYFLAVCFLYIQHRILLNRCPRCHLKKPLFLQTADQNVCMFSALFRLSFQLRASAAIKGCIKMHFQTPNNSSVTAG